MRDARSIPETRDGVPLARWFGEHGTRLRHWLSRRVACPEKAADLAQEVCARLAARTGARGDEQLRPDRGAARDLRAHVAKHLARAMRHCGDRIASDSTATPSRARAVRNSPPHAFCRIGPTRFGADAVPSPRISTSFRRETGPSAPVLSVRPAEGSERVSEPPEPDPKALSDAVIAWLVLLRSGRVSAAERRRLAEWRGRSAQHIRSFEDAERPFGLMCEVGARERLVDCAGSRPSGLVIPGRPRFAAGLVIAMVVTADGQGLQ